MDPAYAVSIRTDAF